MSVTLIDVFAVPQDQREEFLKRWTATTQVYARTERFYRDASAAARAAVIAFWC